MSKNTHTWPARTLSVALVEHTPLTIFTSEGQFKGIVADMLFNRDLGETIVDLQRVSDTVHIPLSTITGLVLAA